MTLLEEVVARDSTWAPGWAGLAQAYSLVPYYEPGAAVGGIAPESWESALGSAEAAAKRALALDPRVAGAHVALGNAYRDRWAWETAEGHYERALEIDPDDVEAHQQYAELLAGTGRVDEALRSARRAVALDPTSAIRLNALGWTLHLNARGAEAVRQLELAIVHGPELAMTYHSLSLTRLAQGDITEAERLWREEYVPRLGLDDTVRAGWAIRDRYRQRPRYDVNGLLPLWQPDLDGIRDDRRFQEALSGALEFAGLSGAVLRRAPAER